MKSTYLLIAGALGLAMAFAHSARASLQITLNDGSGAFTVVDGDGNDLSPLANQIIWSNGVGHTFASFTLLSVISSSNGPGTPTLAGLNTTQLEVTNNSSGSQSLSLAVQDMFTMPGVAGDMLTVVNSLTGNYLAGAGTTASQTTELDDVATATASVAVSSADVNDTSETYGLLTRGGPSFKLETLISSNFGANSSVTLSHTSSAVIPEPMTLAVWSGIFIVGALGIFKRQRHA
jgi:hypothetical protein